MGSPLRACLAARGGEQHVLVLTASCQLRKVLLGAVIDASFEDHTMNRSLTDAFNCEKSRVANAIYLPLRVAMPVTARQITDGLLVMSHVMRLVLITRNRTKALAFVLETWEVCTSTPGEVVTVIAPLPNLCVLNTPRGRHLTESVLDESESAGVSRLVRPY